MLKEVEKQAKELISDYLRKKGVKVEIKFEEPVIEEYGDIATSVCFSLASIFKKSPKSIAEEIALEIKPKGFIKKVRAVNGYLNFYIDYEKFALSLLAKARSKDYGKSKKKLDKIILEHTSANPDGPLHIGHGRNAIIGDTLARILKFYGYEVETQFYVNDMGKQLALVVLGLRKFKLDKEKKKDLAIAEIYVKANKLLEENPEVEEEVAELMRKYEKGELEEEFKSVAEYCLQGIKETLQRMNISIDKFVFESKFVRSSDVTKVVEKLRKTKYAKEKEVLYLDLNEFGIKKELVLTRSDGTYLYTTRDIAYHLWKAKQGKVIDILGADHKLVAQQLKAVMRILGEEEPEIIIYEFITLPEGSMSTRKGKFIAMDELIEESVRRAYAEVDKRRKDANEEFKRSIAEAIGVAAVRFNIVKVSPEKTITFRWEEALDFERQGIPFILYAYARACRILEKVDEIREIKRIENITENEKKLIKLISKFPKIIESSASQRKPHILANYALEIADAFHRFYRFEKVLKSERKDFRVELTMVTKEILKKCLKLLGVKPLESM